MEKKINKSKGYENVYLFIVYNKMLKMEKFVITLKIFYFLNYLYMNQNCEIFHFVCEENEFWFFNRSNGRLCLLMVVL